MSGWLIVVTVIAALYAVYRLTPPNNFDPFCTYDLTYRLNVTIEVGGRQYSSQVVHQESHSRRWIEVMNSAGCLETYGKAVPFRLADDRVVLLRSFICQKAKQQFANSLDEYYHHKFSAAMSEHRKVDLTPYCSGISKNKPQTQRLEDGFVIDNADHPTRWQGFEFGEDLPPPGGTVRLVSATAEAIDTWPADNLDKIVPGVLKTYFKSAQWSASPEAILSFDRRRHTFAYKADLY